MSAQSTVQAIGNTAAAAIVAAMCSATPADANTPLNAATVLKEMPPNELVVYVAGIVEGLAYARFRYDTIAAGQKVETGMNCIRNWYFDDPNIILKIGEAFRKYGEHSPWVVVAAMVKQECGE